MTVYGGRLAKVPTIPSFPSVNPTGRKQWGPGFLFVNGEEGFWADLNTAMGEVTVGDLIGDKHGFWADLQETI